MPRRPVTRLTSRARVGIPVRVALALAASLLLAGGRGAAAPVPPDVVNPTGLPLYPNLASARLADRLRTDGLGHWCLHLSATTADSLDVVETWYRQAMRTASETAVWRDGSYGDGESLDGIKLSLNLDSVAVYTTSKGAPTSIDLTRCSGLG